MDIAKKQRLLVLALACFALWPAVHHVATVSFDMNPWKLFGWSMYCVPRRWVDVAIVMRDTSGEHPLEYHQGQADLAAVVDDYANRRWVYGWPYTPDRVAKRLFAKYPDASQFTIHVHQLSFDRATSRYRRETFEYVYSPEGRRS